VKVTPAAGTAAPVVWSTWPRRGSVVVVPDQFWKVVTHSSVSAGVVPPAEVPVMMVLASEPRLLAVDMVTVIGVVPGLLKTFRVRSKWSSVGT
jgi:hypothetical protein